MNHSNVRTRIHRVNPVPDPADLPTAAWSDTELLRAVNERTRHMRELMNDPGLERGKNRRRRLRGPVLAAGAAFVVALGAIGVAAFVGGEPEPEVDTPGLVAATTLVAPTTVAETTAPAVTSSSDEPTSEQMAVVTAFYAAWSNGDGETMRALVAPGVELERGTGSTPLNDVIKDAEFGAYLSETNSVTSCRLFAEVRVSCRVLAESVMTDTLGSGPMIFQVNLQIEDGLITRWQGDVVFYPGELFSRFTDWVEDVYPDIRPQMSDEMGELFNTDFDPALALQLLNEYAVFLDGE